jgi:Ribonuclease G/E
MQSAFVNIGLEKDAFLYVSDFIEDIASSNTVNGDPFYYLVGQRNMVFSEPAVGFLGLIVDSVSEVLRLSSDTIEPPPRFTLWMTRIADMWSIPGSSQQAVEEARREPVT